MRGFEIEGLDHGGFHGMEKCKSLRVPARARKKGAGTRSEGKSGFFRAFLRGKGRRRLLFHTMKSGLDILKYVDYHKYLHDAYLLRKSADKKFSHRFINQKVGIRSSGWFADILAKRQKLKPHQASTLAVIFKLVPKEREFLRVLIEMERASSSEDRAAAYGKWFHLKDLRQEKVTRDKFKYFERWYYPALRELLTLNSFDGNYAALAAQLCPPIQPRQAKLTDAALMRMGMFLPGSGKNLPTLVKDGASKTYHWRKLLKSYMQLSLPALERFGKEERDFSALTLTLSPEGLKKSGEEIAALRGRLLMISDQDSGKNRVYQCLFQMFPLSHPQETARAK